jgi:hypothetical protein
MTNAELVAGRSEWADAELAAILNELGAPSDSDLLNLLKQILPNRDTIKISEMSGEEIAARRERFKAMLTAGID